VIWYVGGQLAEDGAGESREELIMRAKKELSDTIPGLDWSNKQWSTLMIDRAEGWQQGNKRPDEPVIKTDGRMITVWPTKLVFAPLVGDEVIGILNRQGALPGNEENELPGLSLVGVGEYPWDEAEWVG
jgi:hypothetical protein